LETDVLRPVCGNNLGLFSTFYTYFLRLEVTLCASYYSKYTASRVIGKTRHISNVFVKAAPHNMSQWVPKMTLVWRPSSWPIETVVIFDTCHYRQSWQAD